MLNNVMLGLFGVWIAVVILRYSLCCQNWHTAYSRLDSFS
jgi:hypothetical protein